jgi:hypothetical protein
MTNKDIFAYFAVYLALILLATFSYFYILEDLERDNDKKNFYRLANIYLAKLISEKK